MTTATALALGTHVYVNEYYDANNWSHIGQIHSGVIMKHYVFQGVNAYDIDCGDWSGQYRETRVRVK